MLKLEVVIFWEGWKGEIGMMGTSQLWFACTMVGRKQHKTKDTVDGKKQTTTWDV